MLKRVGLPALLLVGAAIGFTHPTAAAPTRVPAPAPDCLMAINVSGDGSWFCGTTVRIPKGWRVSAPGMPTCTSDDGSGPVPCYWAADERGNLMGRSFTVLRAAAGTLLIRFNDGLTIEEK